MKEKNIREFWHLDGETEKIVAVVLYYYRVSDKLSSENDEAGGKMEFMDKKPIHRPFWVGGDCTPTPFSSADARKKIEKIPHCKVDINEGTLLVFSNYQMVSSCPSK